MSFHLELIEAKKRELFVQPHNSGNERLSRSLERDTVVVSGSTLIVGYQRRNVSLCLDKTCLMKNALVKLLYVAVCIEACKDKKMNAVSNQKYQYRFRRYHYQQTRRNSVDVAV